MPSAAVADVLVAVFADYAAGRSDDARARYNRILPFLNLEMSVLMAVSKETLRRRGIFSHVAMRDPEFPPLDRGDVTELDAIWPAIDPLFAVRPSWAVRHPVRLPTARMAPPAAEPNPAVTQKGSVQA